jgi:hypothetical protein
LRHARTTTRFPRNQTFLGQLRERLADRNVTYAVLSGEVALDQAGRRRVPSRVYIAA